MKKLITHQELTEFKRDRDLRSQERRGLGRWRTYDPPPPYLLSTGQVLPFVKRKPQ
jgi:hypothetical protein